MGAKSEPCGPREPPSSSAWQEVQPIWSEAVIRGESDDGRLGTSTPRPISTTGWNDALLASKSSRVLVLAMTRGTNSESGVLSPWQRKQISYS